VSVHGAGQGWWGLSNQMLDAEGLTGRRGGSLVIARHEFGILGQSPNSEVVLALPLVTAGPLARVLPRYGLHIAELPRRYPGPSFEGVSQRTDFLISQ
jgi:hypothetical protein